MRWAVVAILFPLVAWAGLGLAQQPAAAAHARRPNVLIILADDLGYGDLACYGAKDLRTPRLDALCSQGMRLPNFRANSCVCSPTRAALLSGRWPEQVGVPGVIRTHPDDSWGYLAPGARLLPARLAEAGYATAMVGKWHLGLDAPNTPNEHGFQEFRGFLGDMMDSYTTHRRHDINYMRHNRETVDPAGHATDIFTDWACDYLRSRSGRPDQPFFLYLAYNAPHGPIEPPAAALAAVQRREPGLSPKRAALVALVEHLDSGVGCVLDTLRETGLEENTLVVFSSDNGGDLPAGANCGALRNGKGSMYEGGLRVPAFARWPGRIAANSSSPAAGLSMDLCPTALEAAGVERPREIVGVSLLELLTGAVKELPPRDLFFTRRDGGIPFGGKTNDAVIRGRWKLLQNSPYTPLELYDLEADPLEGNNLAGSERAVFKDLSAALRRQIQRGGAMPWQPPDRLD